MIGKVTAPDGLQISYESRGSGDRALVFIHGWSCDRSYWKAQLPAFEDRYRVVAVDLAGHGESDAGRAAYTIHAFAADVVAVIDELALEDVVLIGHSSGGDVASDVRVPRYFGRAAREWLS
jgi:pimeloyl-ACP methyl ester carboxylesterase